MNFCIYPRFNPCFNGSMYKNSLANLILSSQVLCFNPCFNGSMYKNSLKVHLQNNSFLCFNPCFNGSMYKNKFKKLEEVSGNKAVSILVLMDLCIKT